MRPFTFDEIQAMTYDERLELKRELLEGKPISLSVEKIQKVVGAFTDVGMSSGEATALVMKSSPEFYKTYREQAFRTVNE